MVDAETLIRAACFHLRVCNALLLRGAGSSLPDVLPDGVGDSVEVESLACLPRDHSVGSHRRHFGPFFTGARCMDCSSQDNGDQGDRETVQPTPRMKHGCARQSRWAFGPRASAVSNRKAEAAPIARPTKSKVRIILVTSLRFNRRILTQVFTVLNTNNVLAYASGFGCLVWRDANPGADCPAAALDAGCCFRQATS